MTAKEKRGYVFFLLRKSVRFFLTLKYLAYKGFKVADESDAGPTLMYLPFDDNAGIPQFRDIARHPHIEDRGYVLYYTNQCPFNGKYISVIEKPALENDISFKAIHVESKEQAQLVPSPCTTYAMFL